MNLKVNAKSGTGATLTEVVAAVAILAIAMAGLMGALANGFFSVQLTRENQRATQILIERTEMARLYNWDQITTPGFIVTNFISSYDPQSVDGGGLYYTGTVQLASLPFSPTPNYSTNMRQMTITLNWETKGVPRTRSITTLLGRDGLQNYVY
jgi:type II secretory pathway pseudopilin PulG